MTPSVRNETRNASVNIQDVADAAGVSKTTVSHVLSGNRPVSAATRRKVERVMGDLGFRPNYFARALNSRRSQTVAFIAQDITNPYYPALARGLQATLSAADHVVMLFDAGAGGDSMRTFVDEVIQRRVDGVVISVGDVEPELLRLRGAGIAVVAVGSGTSGLPIDWTSSDDEQIGFDATTRLLQAGRRRIATITGPVPGEPGSGRHAGYLQALARRGVAADPRLVVAGDWTREGGRAAIRRLLSADEPPDAVFCGNDLMAIGALDGALEAGLDVPGDLAVVGVDDIEAAQLVRPALTTIQIPAQEIGRAAGELLLHRLDDPDGTVRHVLVGHRLIVRQSA